MKPSKTWQVPPFTTERVTDPDRGAVHYTVHRVGVYTLTWDDTAHHPGGVDGQSVHVQYGRWDADTWAHGQDWPDPPVLYGVTIAGAAIVSVEAAVAAVDGGPGLWRVPARRASTERAGGLGEVTFGARDRNGLIVAALVTDYACRDDARELLAAHRRYHAPVRLAAATRRIGEYRAEVAAWQRLLDRELLVADEQAALMHGEPPVPAPDPVPARTGDHHAATDPGRWLLRTGRG